MTHDQIALSSDQQTSMPIQGERSALESLSPKTLSPNTIYSAGAVSLALLVVLSALSTDDGPVLCPYRVCTGGYCPGCGLTRAGGHLLRGQVAQSWSQHPYLILMVVQAPLIGLAWITGAFKRKTGLFGTTSKVVIVNVALLVGIWIFRLATNDIPLPFAG